MPLTPLGYLLHKAFIPGQTRVDDPKSTSIAIAPQAGETVLVFKTDGNDFAAHFGIPAKDPRSDAMMLYLLEAKGQPAKVRLVFIELKSGHKQTHAIEQLDRTVQAVKPKLLALFGAALIKPANMRALIVHEGRAPQEIKKKQEEFEKRHGFAPKLCRPAEAELRKHLS